jgi:hypothetical protein
MGLLSNLKARLRGQIPSIDPNISIPPKLTPSLPPRRKGGLAGLIQRVKGRLPERPIPIGGVGGGVGITKSPLQQRVEAIQNAIQPVPVPPGQERQLPIAPLPAIKEPSPLAPPEQRPAARPILRRDDIVPIKPPQLPPKRDSIMSIGGPGGGITDDRAISPLERLIPKQPIPPQDFGFGPGIRPTEIIGPDGQFIGSAGVTPPVITSPVVSPVVTPDPVEEDHNQVSQEQPLLYHQLELHYQKEQMFMVQAKDSIQQIYQRVFLLKTLLE